MRERDRLQGLRKSALARAACVAARQMQYVEADAAWCARAADAHAAETAVDIAYQTWTTALEADQLDPAFIVVHQNQQRVCVRELDRARQACAAAQARRSDCALALALERAHTKSHDRIIARLCRRLARGESEKRQRRSEADALLRRTRT